MVNRHVTPRGRVYRLNFFGNGFLGKWMPPGANFFLPYKSILKNLMPIGYNLGKSQRFTQT
jgi:hypothetical protein